MNYRNRFGITLFGLLLLSTGSGQANMLGSTESSVEDSPLADLPWVNAEIDTPGDTGQYTSIAIDPNNGGIYISYYDAENQELRLANSLWSGWDCDAGNGPIDDWGCLTVDSGADVGKYSSIAIDRQADLGSPTTMPPTAISSTCTSTILIWRHELSLRSIRGFQLFPQLACTPP
jgi:hypothetical protein